MIKPKAKIALQFKIFHKEHLTNKPDLINDILALDKLNMSDTLKKSGWENFDWNLRRNVLQKQSNLLIAVYLKDQLIAYLDLKQEKDCLHLVSLQIQQNFQNGILLKKIIHFTFQTIEFNKIELFKTRAQIANHRMKRILQKLGFRLIEGERNDTLEAIAKFEELNNSKLFQYITS